ncbi:hypothetical protein PSTG_16646 [Puccinia striiformis f. sp. tritici PST-78]|uniref:Uncharacterized protein n=1 Tax=Puccinia striiformis f. sp. tritici PST-78 TaxID=1165861 RepID=A0A0L0US45_9BASI|nr:hypothetical protein PSTG_16646 [Puccinia striiformis f. sp. tritici PST-78]
MMFRPVLISSLAVASSAIFAAMIDQTVRTEVGRIESTGAIASMQPDEKIAGDREAERSETDHMHATTRYHTENGTKHQEATTERLSDMKGNWKDQEGKRGLLREDLQDLRRSYNDVHDENKKARWSHGLENPDQILDFINECQKNMEVFMKLKILELGKSILRVSNEKLLKLSLTVNSRSCEEPNFLSIFPHELSSEISKLAWKVFGDSIVNEIEKHLDYRMDSSQFQWHTVYMKEFTPKANNLYLMKSIDLLYKDSYVTEEALRNLFQNDKFLLLASAYNVWHLRSKAVVYQDSFLEITKSWCWQKGFKFLMSLNKVEEMRLNFLVLTEQIICRGNVYRINFEEDSEWNIFLKSFSNIKYSRKLSDIDQSRITQNSKSSYDYNSIIHKSFNSEDFIRVDIRNIMIFLFSMLAEKNGQGLRLFDGLLAGKIIEFLYFVETNIYPGIIMETKNHIMETTKLGERPKQLGYLLNDNKSFMDWLYLISTSSRVLISIDSVEHYESFMCSGGEISKSEAVQIKSMYEELEREVYNLHVENLERYTKFQEIANGLYMGLIPSKLLRKSLTDASARIQNKYQRHQHLYNTLYHRIV